MAWFFDVHDLRIGFNNSYGGQYIVGSAKQQCRVHNAEGLSAVKLMNWANQIASIAIYPTTASELVIDLHGKGFYQRVQQNPEKVLGWVTYWEDEHDNICTTLFLPERYFRDVWDMAKVKLLTTRALVLSICVDLVAFRSDQYVSSSSTPPDTDLITVNEFLARKPMIFTEASFQLREMTPSNQER